MKILIFIETDVVIRHFIFSKAFHELHKFHNIVYVFPDGDKRLGNISLDKLDLKNSKRLTLMPYVKRLKLWRLRFFVEKLRRKKDVPNEVLKQWRRDFRLGNPLYAKYIYQFFGLPFVFNIFTLMVNLLIKRLPNLKLIKILKKERPDILIHPSVLEGSYIDDVVFYGNKFKIPVVVIMNSWDNPLTKRSVVNKDYFLLVWGPQTKQHAIKYMGLDKNKVLEFGAAQFDIYNFSDFQLDNNNNKVIDIDKKTLLYAGSSKFCDEFSHLVKIDEAIIEGLLPAMKVIYRPHPWGQCGYRGDRFKNYNFENVIFDENMKEYLSRDFSKDYSKFLPKLEDTKDLLLKVDFVLSPLSTILVEAMLLGKVPICLMPENELQAEHYHMVKKSPHFKEILENKEIIVINGTDSLIDGIKIAFNDSNSANKSNVLKKDSEFFISRFSKPFNKRLLELVEKINY
ncbi:hypothetical protein OA859_00685 [Prochlorococcus sp. AH-716-D13]|nr:hypothetical protein [Prochlorococcus sp. AH-716-D13]